MTEDVTITYRINGETETQDQSGTGIITLTQTGNTVRYYQDVPNPNTGGTYRAERVGTIEGDTVTFKGIAMVPVQGLHFSKNSMVSVGKIHGNRIDATSTIDVAFSGGGVSGTVTGGGTELFEAVNPAYYMLSGTVRQGAADGPPLANVSIQLAGASFTRSATTDANGAYQFYGLLMDTYTVTPSAAGLNFDPPSQSVFLTQDAQLPPFIALAPVLTLHRVTPAALDTGAPSSIDSPLRVNAAPAVLANLPSLGAGLVADGVTPLVLKFQAHPPVETAYQIQMTTRGGSVSGLSGKLKVLTAGGFAAGSSFTLSASKNQAFTCLEGVDRNELHFEAGQREINVDVSILAAGTEVARAAFAIRRPPVVLVHGFTGNRNDWRQTFLNELAATWPEQFVVRVEYGTQPNNPAGNGPAPLLQCATSLDATLKLKVESETDPGSLKHDWAFTRYDLVGYSQGGVVMRYLALKDGHPPIHGFRSADNLNRGRFDRMVTIGAPHAGFLPEYYLQAVSWAWWRLIQLKSLPFFGRDGHEKFNPFGPQITELNGLAPDPAARFHAIRCRINQGNPPNGNNIFLYGLLGLYDPPPAGMAPPQPRNIGDIVLPAGADGVVDFDSEGGGLPAYALSDIPEQVSHSENKYRLYGELPADAFETASPAVGREVVRLLTGDASAFAALRTETLRVKPGVRERIDEMVDLMRRPEVDPGLSGYPPVSGFIVPITGPGALDLGNSGEPSFFRLDTGNHPAIQDSIIWMGAHYSTNGVDFDGFTLTIDTNDTRRASLLVDSNTVGEIVLQARYVADGNLAFVSEPFRAFADSGTAAVAGLAFAYPELALTPGQFTNNPVLGRQADGAWRALYFVPADGAGFRSGDTNIVRCLDNGYLQAMGAGVTTIQVDYSGSSATARVVVSPGNDSFDERQTISAGRLQASNVNATKETGESNHAGNAGGHSVWFSWRAPKSGQCTVDTLGSSFDTVLAVYQGDSLPGLKVVAGNNNNGGNTTSRVTFTAVAGTEYQIAVDGVNGASGSINLGLSFVVTGAPAITRQPADKTVAKGKDAIFTVSATGAAPLSYQWMKDGLNLDNGGRITGAASGTLRIAQAADSDEGGYSVVITNKAGAATSGVARLKVVPETVSPKLTVASLKPNAIVGTAIVLLHGTASDNVAVDSLWYRLNTNVWIKAEGTTNWQAQVALTPGTNLLQVCAVDSSGNFSATNSLKLIYVVSAPLTVQTVGPGTVVPDLNGKLLPVGESRTLTAKPAGRAKFLGWTGSLTSLNPALSFTMASNLTFVAAFAEGVRPVNIIKYPAVNAKVTNDVITAAGKASDNTGVVMVRYRFNTNDWTPALTSNNWTNWTTAPLLLQPNMNVLQAFAEDAAHNFSLTNTVKFIHP